MSQLQNVQFGGGRSSTPQLLYDDTVVCAAPALDAAAASMDVAVSVALNAHHFDGEAPRAAMAWAPFDGAAFSTPLVAVLLASIMAAFAAA